MNGRKAQNSVAGRSERMWIPSQLIILEPGVADCHFPLSRSSKPEGECLKDSHSCTFLLFSRSAWFQQSFEENGLPEDRIGRLNSKFLEHGKIWFFRNIWSRATDTAPTPSMHAHPEGASQHNPIQQRGKLDLLRQGRPQCCQNTVCQIISAYSGTTIDWHC